MRTELVELLPRLAFLAPLIRGARLLEIGAVESTGGETAVRLLEMGAASVVALGSAAAIEEARRSLARPGLDLRSEGIAALPAASVDLALLHDPAPVLEPGGAAALRRAIAPGGYAVVALPAGGPSLLPGRRGSPWAEAIAALHPHFPSIEVATQQAVFGWLVAPVGAEEPALAIEPAPGEADPPAFHLLVCGERIAGLTTQTLLPLPAAPLLAVWEERGADLARELARSREAVAELQARLGEASAERVRLEGRVASLERRAEDLDREREALSASLARAEARAAALEAELAAERERAGGAEAAGGLEGESAELAAARARVVELEAALRQVESRVASLAGPVPAARVEPVAAPWDEETAGRIRRLEEEAEDARRRAREAEERLRAVERRLDEAEAARAESVAAARRWQLEAETARREAAGVAAGMADREELRRQRDEALARAAEEAGRLQGARSQLQAALDRALAAERQVELLRAELALLRGAADPNRAVAREG